MDQGFESKGDGGSITQPPSASRKVSYKFTVGEPTNDVYCVRFDPQDRYVATGCKDGTIRVYNVLTGKLSYKLEDTTSQPISMPTEEGEEESKELKMPITAIRWRPMSSASKTKNVLISVHADGSVRHWHTTSGKCLHQIHDDLNQLYCIDYNPTGRAFVTAGRDLSLRMYDEATKQLAITFTGGAASPGHSNRIFAVRYNTEDENIIISGGWDNTIQIWDVRTGQAVRSIFGPHLCGDALDIKDGCILTGSWRPADQIQQFNLGSGELITTVDWDGGQGMRRSQDPCLVYSVQYSKHDSGEIFLAGGSKSNEVRFFDTMQYMKPFAGIMDFEKPVFSCDFSHAGQMVAVSSSDGMTRIYNISKLG